MDPTFLLRQGFQRTNLCLPACVIMALHSKLGGSLNRNLTISRMEEQLEALNFRSLLTVGRVGIPLNQLSKFEDINSCPIRPSLLRLFPSLGFFKGISVNQFILRRSDKDFSLFPVSLSKFSRDLDRFQVDLLIESPDLREKSPFANDNPSNKHLLVITNLVSLLAKMKGKTANVSKYTAVCRSCLRLFRWVGGPQGSIRHNASCDHEPRGVKGRRKTTNQLIHRPYIKDAYTGQFKRNGLWFKRGFGFKRLKVLVLGNA